MNKQKKSGIKKVKALLPADPALAKLDGQSQILKTMSIVPELARKIEPVGKAYALLQGKFMRNQQRKDNKEIEDSEESEIEEESSPDQTQEADDD